MDLLEEMWDEKKPDGVRKQYRWTDEEAVTMMQCIAKMVKESQTKFEQPTARQFYEDLKDKYYLGCKIDWRVMKSKMRHLKRSYSQALEWKDNVGMQLYDSDQSHIQKRIKRICPHYNLLDEIFGPTFNADPIGIRIPGKQMGDENGHSEFIDNPAKKARNESFEQYIVPKTEALIDEQDTFVDEYEESQDETFQSNSAFDYYVQTKNTSKTTRSNAKSTDTSFEERTLQLEIRKFEAYHKLQVQKFNFEKQKFLKIQRLRKYEIDKQFAIKKYEIDSNERIKLLEVNKANEAVANGVEDVPTDGQVAKDVEECPESP